MTMSFDFTGKRTLVVGGTSGIGNGIARGFLGHGADVTVWGTRPDAAAYHDQVDSDLSGISYASVDVTDADRVSNAAAQIEALDVLVLCQGAVLYKRQEYTAEGWNRVRAVNLDSLLYCSNAFHAALARTRGALIIISSGAAYAGAIGNPAYAASKAGAVSFTRSLSRAWAPDGIRVNGIAPGFVDTRLTAITTKNEARLEATVATIPVGRLGTPQDMAGAALFLASPMAAYICGQTVIVDGGISA